MKPHHHSATGAPAGARRAWALRWLSIWLLASAGLNAQTSTNLPIADAHVHYSHDSVELTPPDRVIELMREANLKFALVSSSDDNGTQLLSDLAPDLIVPGLRPYRRRGELSSWLTNPDALEYVEKLLATNRYATIGEFHVSGENADLDIPRKIVQLADKHNLVLHAHSDADAVERMLKQSPTVKILWAHSGFDSPGEIADMLGKHDRLWADLAFRSEVGSGGSLSEEWTALFQQFPDRMMLGTDTYTPERMYYLPEHAAASRIWLATLPPDLAEKVAWKNAFDLLMPVWSQNRGRESVTKNSEKFTDNCLADPGQGALKLGDDNLTVHLKANAPIVVSEPFSVTLTLCGEFLTENEVTSDDVALDTRMPAHGHAMNYTPEITLLEQSDHSKIFNVEGIVLHMPGQWQWKVDVTVGSQKKTLTHDFSVN